MRSHHTFKEQLRLVQRAKRWKKQPPAPTFATRTDAEKEIARRNLAGKKKATRILCRWEIVDNDRDTITLSQFIQCAIVEHERAGIRKSIKDICIEATQMFREHQRRSK